MVELTESIKRVKLIRIILNLRNKFIDHKSFEYIEGFDFLFSIIIKHLSSHVETFSINRTYVLENKIKKLNDHIIQLESDRLLPFERNAYKKALAQNIYYLLKKGKTEQVDKVLRGWDNTLN